MLTYVATVEEQIRERALAASTFVAQPFWQELQKYLHECVAERLRAVEEAKYASDETKARLQDRWTNVKELVARIERFPQAAIEAAREQGEMNVG